MTTPDPEGWSAQMDRKLAEMRRVAEHDCAATSRTYFLGIGSCDVCHWSVWDDIRTTVSSRIRLLLSGDLRHSRHYRKAMGMRRVFTWRYGWEWTSGDPERFKQARCDWEREVGKR